MSRIPTPASIEAAPAAAQPLLEALKKQLVKQRGDVSEADMQAVKDAGHSDAQLVEIILHAALKHPTPNLRRAIRSQG